MGKVYSIHEYLKNKIYKNNSHFTKEEMDVLLIILAYIMDSLSMSYTDIKKLNWKERISVTFRNKKENVINIYLSVYDHFNVPISHQNIPFKDTFTRNILLGEMILDMKNHVLRCSHDAI